MRSASRSDPRPTPFGEHLGLAGMPAAHLEAAFANPAEDIAGDLLRHFRSAFHHHSLTPLQISPPIAVPDRIPQR
jgi:hypothetical protein